MKQDLDGEYGASVLEETIIIGDEQGLLWSITNGLVHNTSLTQEVQGIETPKIRHAPIILDDFVLVSVQGQSSGKVLLLNNSSGPDFQIIHEFDIGMSSSIPTKINQTAAIVGSSAGLQLVDCSDTCSISESLSDNINGEIFYREGVIVAARNGENGGWVYAQVNNSKLEPLGNFQIQLSGWGAAMPANCGSTGSMEMIKVFYRCMNQKPSSEIVAKRLLAPKQTKSVPKRWK